MHKLFDKNPVGYLIEHFKNRIDKKTKDFVHENVYDIEAGEIKTYYVGYFLMKIGI
jgi:hypothetical protein